jgi:ribosome-binding protein aMBF1 (putative translation factor)
MLLLQRERERKGLSKSKLARNADLQVNVLSWTESLVPCGTGGKVSPRWVPYDVQLEKLARALDWKGNPAGLLDEVNDDATS